jgi:hypothetical protein
MVYNIQLLGEIIRDVKQLARNYYLLTGRPLGVTGEIAEYEAARLLGLQLSEARQAGYDATYEEDGRVIRVQIKGRCILENSKPGQRLGSIKLNHEWDAIVLVLLDSNLEPTYLYLASRPEVEEAISAPGSKARNERGALSISKFKSISQLVWESPQLING